MSGIFSKIHKHVAKVLFITLGTMWLSFAIAPCVLAASFDDRPHHCCPNLNGKAGNNEHMHEEDKCVSCDAVQPVLDSTDGSIQSSIPPSFDYEPITFEWNIYQITKPISVATKLPTPVYLPIPPPLQYRVLLI